MKTPKNTPAAVPATAAPATAKRIAPELTAVSTAVAMPVRVNNRGSKSLYPFADLVVGGSFGVKNKDAKTLASIVSNQNRKSKTEKLDADGNIVFKTSKLTGADGTETTIPTDKPEMVAEKHFFAYDVDAKSDPDGASVRVFRDI